MKLFRKFYLHRDYFENVLLSKLKYELRLIDLERDILTCTTTGVTSERYTDHDIIVSLTSYGKRINEVYIAVESILRQSKKPNRIILWLSDDMKYKKLPALLKSQMDRGLEVMYCEDIRSYTKLVPAIENFPNDAIITVDDDLIYEINVLDQLIRPYLENQNNIYYNRGHRITFDKKGNVSPYNKWEWISNKIGHSPLNFPTGVGGVLYPPKCFNQEVLNKDVFLSICKYADDIWFKAMALYNNTPSIKVHTHSDFGEDYVENPSVQDVGLRLINVGENLNDIQFNAVFERYKLFDLLNS